MKDENFELDDERFNRCKSQAFESYNKYWDNLEKARKGIDKYMKARESRKKDLRDYAYGELTGPCECELGQCDQTTNEFCKADESMREYRIGDNTTCEKGEERMEKENLLEKIYKEKNLGDGRFGLEDENVATKLLDKQYSPMIIRRYTRIGFPLFVSMICDYNLNNLDNLVHECIDFCQEKNILDNTIQGLRNFTGILSDYIDTYYNSQKRGCVESIAIVFYADKALICSLKGDAMNSFTCRDELYHGIQIMTQI